MSGKRKCPSCKQTLKRAARRRNKFSGFCSTTCRDGMTVLRAIRGQIEADERPKVGQTLRVFSPISYAGISVSRSFQPNERSSR